MTTNTYSDTFDSRLLSNNAATVYEFPRIVEEMDDTSSTLLKVSIDTNHLIPANYRRSFVNAVHLPIVKLDNPSSMAHGSCSDSLLLVLPVNSSSEEMAKFNSETSLLKDGSRTTNFNEKNVKESGRLRVGRWTLDEKVLFLYGLKKFGKGRWKKISFYVPDR